MLDHILQLWCQLKAYAMILIIQKSLEQNNLFVETSRVQKLRNKCLIGDVT